MGEVTVESVTVTLWRGLNLVRFLHEDHTSRQDSGVRLGQAGLYSMADCQGHQSSSRLSLLLPAQGMEGWHDASKDEQGSPWRCGLELERD